MKLLALGGCTTATVMTTSSIARPQSCNTFRNVFGSLCFHKGFALEKNVTYMDSEIIITPLNCADANLFIYFARPSVLGFGSDVVR